MPEVYDKTKVEVILKAINCAEQILAVQHGDLNTRRAARENWYEFLDTLKESPHRGAAVTAHWDTIERVD